MWWLVVNLYFSCQCACNDIYLIASKVVIYILPICGLNVIAYWPYDDMMSISKVGEGSSSIMQWKWWSMSTLWIVEKVPNCWIA